MLRSDIMNFQTAVVRQQIKDDAASKSRVLRLQLDDRRRRRLDELAFSAALAASTNTSASPSPLSAEHST